ncbi:metalloprotease PmbA [Aquisalimonas sp.]|uniref:metalloprotease PmbA n=1 Tax=Aquisalimonas sp. TaxID=1872621 RepID=UPI0025C264B6|nr:metalloprotease PmbA [Aquisalimonas sp.]
MTTPTVARNAGLPTQDELVRIVEQVLEEARRMGATSAEAAVNVGTGLSVQVRRGEVETLEHERDRALGVGVYFGHRQGTASSSDFSADSVRETVAAACSIARYTSEDPAHGLADPDHLARDIPDLDLDHPWALTVDEAIERALTCEAAALDTDARISNSEGAGVSTSRSLRVYGTSHGFLGSTVGTQHGMNCVVIAGEGADMQRDYWYTVAREAGALETPEAVGRRAAERAVRRLGSRQAHTGRMPVLYVPEAARGLIGHFLGAVRGSNLYRHASFLLDHLGEQVFPAHVTMTEYPHLPRALGSAPFDNEGVATAERVLVDGGVLRGYVLDSYSARKLGLTTTGNAGGVHNLTVAPGVLDFDGLLRDMGRGLVVTELMGQGANPVTGDYSRGAAGFLVENGQLADPVAEITVAGNLRDMFRNLRAVGTDMDTRGSVRTGSLLLDDVVVAGQ